MAEKRTCDRCGKEMGGGRILITERKVCNKCYGELEFTEGPVPNHAIDDGVTPETYRTQSGTRPKRLEKILGPLA